MSEKKQGGGKHGGEENDDDDFDGEEYVMDQPAMIAAYQQYHQAQTHAQPNSEKQQYQDSFDTSAEIQGIDWGISTTSAEDNNKKSKQQAAADPASGLFTIGGLNDSF